MWSSARGLPGSPRASLRPSSRRHGLRGLQGTRVGPSRRTAGFIRKPTLLAATNGNSQVRQRGRGRHARAAADCLHRPPGCCSIEQAAPCAGARAAHSCETLPSTHLSGGRRRCSGRCSLLRPRGGADRGRGRAAPCRARAAAARREHERPRRRGRGRGRGAGGRRAACGSGGRGRRGLRAARHGAAGEGQAAPAATGRGAGLRRAHWLAARQQAQRRK
jgi:hypothetical protein